MTTDGPTGRQAVDDKAAHAVEDEATLWERYAATRRRDVRNALVERHLGLAHHIAGRVAGRADDDVRQVALLALVRAVDRFDATRGIPFSAFAGVTIEGAVKQHLERVAWPVGVSRRLKHLALDVTSARAHLEQTLGRSPTIAELSARLNVDRDDVVEALAAAQTRAPAPMDRAVQHEESAPPRSDADPTGAAALDRTEVEELLGSLTGIERQVFELRFVSQLLQDQIAGIVGVSQMQVSRIIRRCVAALREQSDGGGLR